ncbi:hypothetical protein WJX73_009677 [Symbiochloris irregularis]|uniref:Uncharacterized protein n=1 Tax=Symbiochloris irregularis TaxID=706552 RepID=A0AAW1P2K9_9CHLO
MWSSQRSFTPPHQLYEVWVDYVLYFGPVYLTWPQLPRKFRAALERNGHYGPSCLRPGAHAASVQKLPRERTRSMRTPRHSFQASPQKTHLHL